LRQEIDNMLDGEYGSYYGEKKMNKVKVYSTQHCSYCVQAKNYLQSNGIDYESVMIDENIDAAKLMMSKGLRTVPQIFIGEEHIGGYDKLRLLSKDDLQAKIGV